MNALSIGSRVAILPLLLGLAACTPGKEDKPPAPKVGANADAGGGMTHAAMALPTLAPAPAWTLSGIDGSTVSSEQFKGKVVVVDFWATWCGPCVKEIPGYAELFRKYGKDGLVIVGVSLDQAGPEVVKDFAARYKVNYPLVMGDEKTVAAFGGVEAIPTTFLIDREGNIRDRKIGMEPTESYEKKIVALLNG